MPIVVMSSEELARSLSIRDLTDPEAGPHAIQHIVSEAVAALAEAWSIPVRTHRAHPVVTVADNYDSLHYPKEGMRVLKWAYGPAGEEFHTVDVFGSLRLDIATFRW